LIGDFLLQSFQSFGQLRGGLLKKVTKGKSIKELDILTRQERQRECHHARFPRKPIFKSSERNLDKWRIIVFF